jgi:hypothetical protein
LSALPIIESEKMRRKGSDKDILDFKRATALLESFWRIVATEASAGPDMEYVKDTSLRQAIQSCVNHRQVAYRFCLPIQLLGKMTNTELDSLRLQKKPDDPEDVTGWDARSLASKVVAPFNQRQENILGTSSDPYVGNPMRIPRMSSNDPSKKDMAGWNTLVSILEQVESRDEKNAYWRH